MVKSEWGQKRKCPKCGAFFYDMGKENFACPKCKAKYTLDSFASAKQKQLMKLAKKSAPKLDDADLDEEALLKMNTDMPLNEEDSIGPDGLDILEDDDLMDNKDLSSLVDIEKDDMES